MIAALTDQRTAPAATVGTVIGVAIIVTVVAIYVLLWWWVKQSLNRSGPGDGPDDRGGPDTNTPPPCGPLPDPRSDWWPDFERGFAAHVAEHVRHD